MGQLVEFATDILATQKELLVWDLWRLAIIGIAALALLALLWGWYRRKFQLFAIGWFVVALVLLVAAIVVRPGSILAWAAIAISAVMTGISIVGLLPWDRSGPSTSMRSSVTATRIVAAILLVAGLGEVAFQVAWPMKATQRAQALEEMRRRPGDAWPRGSGHTMLSGFGVPIEQRAWLEAGGSLSPALKSFGVSIWVVDTTCHRVTTSDDIDLDIIRHAYRRQPDGSDAIEISTPYYLALWQVSGANSYRLIIDNNTDSDQHLELVVRSVGPAGGPIAEIAIDSGQLILDQRWQLTLPDGAEVVGLGDERSLDIDDCTTPPQTTATSADGWAFAKVRLPKGASVVAIEDTSRPAGSAAPRPLSDGLELSGFPTEFTNRLAALEATLLSGFVGDQTRPGDPVNYPLQWQRDGAYMLVALARTGHAVTAMQFAGQFIDNDFFGGFGAEADAPGLSLWALGEISTALGNEGFDGWAWPHVERKVGLIQAMLDTPGEMRVDYMGPVVRRAEGRADLDLIARPSRDGLIDGRMDWQWPIFYVNAVNYLGLLEAASLAKRFGKTDEADNWAALAAELKQAYRRKFASLPADDPDLNNKRTSISGLWPADIAEPGEFALVLAQRWWSEHSPDGSFKATPLWTYFAFAQAHQWLRLGQIAPVLNTLAWFDAHDVIPGLQVHWEGDGEENASGLWRDVRGHLAPPAVTPHFWASAEALLLMTEMLAYTDQDRGRLVIGAGVPPAWLAKPLSVKRVGSAIGPVSWSWDGNDTVAVEATHDIAVELGPSFPKNAIIIRLNEASQ